MLSAGLGWYLLRVGKRSHSLILEADSQQVLTDCFTGFGMIAGLGLVLLTGWKPFLATALEQGLPPWNSPSLPKLIPQLASLEDHVHSTEHYTGRVKTDCRLIVVDLDPAGQSALPSSITNRQSEIALCYSFIMVSMVR